MKRLGVMVIAAFGIASELAGAESATSPPLEQRLLSANGLLNRGLYELALGEYEGFLEAAPRHEQAATARYGLGVCLYRLGRFSEAGERLDGLLDLKGFPFAAEAGVLRGQCLIATEQYGAAAEVLGRVVARFPDHTLMDEGAASWVEALYLAGRRDEAAAEGERALQRSPESRQRDRVLYFTGLSRMDGSQFDLAARYFERLLQGSAESALHEPAAFLLAHCREREGQRAAAVKQYLEVVRGGGAHTADGLASLGALYFQEGQLAEAAGALDRLLGEFPQSAHGPQSRLIRSRIWIEQGQPDRALDLLSSLEGECGTWCDQVAYWRAKCGLRLEQSGPAIGQLEELLARYPDSAVAPEAMFDLGVARLRGGDLAGSLAAWEQFRRRFPAHALGGEALRMLAVTAHQAGDYEKSQAACEVISSAGGEGMTAEIRFLAGENDFLRGRFEPAAAGYRKFISEFPSHEDALKAKLRLGLSLYELERYAEAEPLLADVVGAAGEEPWLRGAFLALGEMAFSNGNWAGAKDQLQRYLRFAAEDGKAGDTWLKIGLSFARQEQYEPAVAAFQTVLNRYPESGSRVQALFELGQSYAALKRLDEAAAAFRAVLSAGEDGALAAHALNHLGSIATQQGRPEEAAALYARLAQRGDSIELRADATYEQGLTLASAGKLPEAEETFRRFVAQFPSDARSVSARMHGAVLLARMDRCVEAVGLASGLSDGLMAGAEPGLQTGFEYEIAWCLRSEGKSEEAIRWFGRVANRGDAGAHGWHARLELAELYRRGGSIERSAEELRTLRAELAQAGPAPPADLVEQCLYRLGAVELELERYEAAAACLEEFLAAFPESSLAAAGSFACGRAYARAGGHEKAIPHLSRVVKEFGPDPVTEPAMLQLGESLAQTQRWPQSEEALTTFLERFPENDQAYRARFGVGWARENAQRFDEAMAAYRKVVETHQGPTAARAQFQIGECLFAQQKYEDAARELLKVDILYAYPEWSAAAVYEAGRCFERMGKATEARSQFEQVRTRHGQTQWAQLASQRLADLANAASLPGR